MSDWTENWAFTELGEVCKVVRGITFPASAKEEKLTSRNVCCLRTTNIQKEVDWDDVYFVSKEYVKRDEQFVKIGDILMSMANSYELVGKVSVVRELPYLSAFGAFISAVRPLAVIDAQYLFHVLRTTRVQSELRQGSSQTVNIANISISRLSEIEIQLDPLNEQKRIAEKLDSLLARLDSCQSHLERVPEILKHFRQSVLAAATSGRLLDVASSGVENFLPLSEVIERLKTGPFGSTLHKSDYISNGIPLVNPTHINNGHITPSSEVTITEKKAKQLQEFRLTRGDVVLARRGVMGRCAVVGEKEEGWLCGSGSMLLRPTDQVLSEYLQMFLSSPITVANLEADSVGSTMSNLNQKILLGLTIHVPSIEEQTEIVRRVEKLFAYAERLEARYLSVSERVKQLTPSLLAKAFRGELVEQDPSDEPASALLERIREARIAQPVVSRGSIKGRETREYKMEETLEEIIRDLAIDTFSFEDLQEKYSGDYEKLKDELFKLLSSENPIITQVFDKSSQSMIFVRRK